MLGAIILFKGWYSPALCRARPDLVFVFGDNLVGSGTGGQACIRSCHNAFGVPTKRLPKMTAGAFFSDDNYQDSAHVLRALHTIEQRLLAGETFVIPVTEEGEPSLGLERARLREKAPRIYQAIKTRVEEWCHYFPVEEIRKTTHLHSE